MSLGVGKNLFKQTMDTLHKPSHKKSAFFTIKIYLFLKHISCWGTLPPTTCRHARAASPRQEPPWCSQLGAAFANGNLLKCFGHCYWPLLVPRPEVAVQRTRVATSPGVLLLSAQHCGLQRKHSCLRMGWERIRPRLQPRNSSKQVDTAKNIEKCCFYIGSAY